MGFSSGFSSSPGLQVIAVSGTSKPEKMLPKPGSMSNRKESAIRAMAFALNPKLDIAALTDAYRARKRLQVRDFLSPETADAMHHSLAAETPWGFIYFNGTKGQKIPRDAFNNMAADEKNQIYQQIFTTARDSYQYMYYFFPAVKSYQGEDCSQSALYRFYRFLNSDPVLDFARQLTGLDDITRCDAQATRYVGNCFLHSHMDQHEGGTRRAAYVMNLTRNWNPNWGGFLQFFRDDLGIEQAFRPDFNVLNVFTVPQAHSVSCVPPYCPSERLSITGWFHAGEADDGD